MGGSLRIASPLCQRTQLCLRFTHGSYRTDTYIFSRLMLDGAYVFLKKEYPNLGDEELYRHARLVTSAVIAKVHTIDWTVELLKTDTMRAGMRTNW